MADYVIRVQASTETAEEKLRRVERRVESLDKDVKINVNAINVDAVTRALQTLGQTTLTVGKQALDLSRKLNVGPGAVLNDLEHLFDKVATKGKQTASVLNGIAQATPTRILGTAFNTATEGAVEFSRRVADVGYEIFGVTQSVNILKTAFDGFFNDTIGREIQLQEALLRTKTTLISTSDVIQNGQRIRDPFKALQALDKPIEKTFDNIRRRSLDIAGTTSEAIISVFSVIASQVGGIGGSLKDAEDLAISFAGALGTIGMADPYLANQEIRSIMTGNIGPDSMLARMLGITGADITKAKASSEGLVKYLQRRLEGFAAGQKIAAQGFAGITSNIKEIEDEVKRAFGAQLLAPLLDSLTVVYLNLSKIFDQLKAIAGNAGGAIANVVNIVKAAGQQAPITQSIKIEPAANAAKEFTENFKQTVAAKVQEIQPLISRIINEVLEGIGRITQGLGALAKGFVYFKFEELKILATTFANIATLLNNTVVPALQAMLNLYGQFLQLPIVNYLHQVRASHEVLEKIGVNSIIRLIATWKFFQESINTAIGWVRTAVNAVKTGIQFILDAVANLMEGIGSIIKNGLGAAVSLVVTIINAGLGLISRGLAAIGLFISDLATKIGPLLGGVAALLAEAGVALSNVALRIGELYPALAPIASLVAGLAKAFVNLSRTIDGLDEPATNATANIAKGFTNLSRAIDDVTLDMKELEVSAKQALGAVQAGVNNAAGKTRALGATIGTALGAGAKKFGGFLLGIGKEFIKFQAMLFVFQALTAAATDMFGRIQRAQERAKQSKDVEDAIKRLGTAYQDTGKQIDETTKRQQNFDKQLLNTAFDANMARLKEMREEYATLTKDLEDPQINSFGELGRVLTPDIGDVFTQLKRDFSWVGEFIGWINEGFKSLNKETKIAFGTLAGLMSQANALTSGVGWGYITQEIGKWVSKLAFLKPIIKFIADAFTQMRAGIREFNKFLNPSTGPRLLPNIFDLFGKSRQVTKERLEKETEQLEKQQAAIEAALADDKAAEDAQLAARERTNSLKELKNLERQLNNDIFQAQQANHLKEIENATQVGNLRIEKLKQANLAALKNNQTETSDASKRLEDFLANKRKRENELEADRKKFQLEMLNLEQDLGEYRIALEEKIAAIRARGALGDQTAAGGAAGGSGLATFGETGNVSNAKGWVHGHFQTKTGTLNDVITDVVPVLKQLLADGIPVELGNGFRVPKDKGDAYYRDVLAQAAQQHGHSGDGRSIDLFVPKGTRVPVPLSGVTSASTGNEGISGVLPGTGHTWVGHLAPGSQSGGLPANASTAQQNMAGYLKRLSFLETELKNVPNAEGSGAQGFFQTMEKFHAEAMAASGGRNSRSANYGEAAYATEAWIRKFNKEATRAIEKGQFNVADILLNQTWPSLPGGSQAQKPEKQQRALQYLPGGSLANAQVGAGMAPTPATGAPDANFEAKRQKLEATKRRQLALQQQGLNISAQTKDFENKQEYQALVDALIVKRPIEELGLEKAQRQFQLQNILSRPLGITDNREIELTDSIISEGRKVVFSYQKLKDEQTKLVTNLQTQIKSGKLSGDALKQATEELQTRSQYLKDNQKALQTNTENLLSEAQLRYDNLQLLKQTELAAALYNDRSQIPLNLQAVQQGTLIEAAKLFNGNNITGGFQIDAEARIADRLRTVEQSGVALTPELIDSLRAFAAETRAAADVLGEMGESAREFAMSVGRAREAAATVTEGYKSFLGNIIMGGNVTEALDSMLENVASRFLDMALSYAFEPVQKTFEKIFMGGLGLEDPKEALQSQNNEQLASLKASNETLKSSNETQLVPALQALRTSIESLIPVFGNTSTDPLAPQPAATSIQASAESGITSSNPLTPAPVIDQTPVPVKVVNPTPPAPGAPIGAPTTLPTPALTDTSTLFTKGFDLSTTFPVIDPALFTSFETGLSDAATNLSTWTTGLNATQTGIGDLGLSTNTLSTTLNNTATSAQQTPSFFQKMGGAIQGAIGALAGVAVGIAGVQQMGKGGTYNTLMGLAGITSGLAGVFGAFTPMGGLADLFRAKGGPVQANRPYIVGEQGPELFMPNKDGEIHSNKDTKSMFSNTRASLSQSRARMERSQSTERGKDGPPQPIKVAYESKVINNVEYVTTDQLRSATKEAAERGRALAYQGMQQSVRVRKRLGI